MLSTEEKEKENKRCFFKIEKVFGGSPYPFEKNVGVEN